MFLLTNNIGTTYSPFSRKRVLDLLNDLNRTLTKQNETLAGIVQGFITYIKQNPELIEFKSMNKDFNKKFYYDNALKFRQRSQFSRGGKSRKTKKIRKSNKSRKTKKLRKQRGGFVYNKNTKRRKITTMSTPVSSQRRSTSQRRTTSRRSSGRRSTTGH